LVHASVVGVVHEVMDRVDTPTTTSVAASWAAESGRSFRRCVADEVPGASASTLERVEQTNPVASFVCEGLSQVIWSGGASWERGEEYNDAIVFWITSVV